MDQNFLKKLMAAETLDQLADELEYALRDLGFAGFAYWTHQRRPVAELIGNSVFLLSRGPAHLKSFEAAYLARGLYNSDPVFVNASAFEEPFTSAEARASAQPTRRQRWIYMLEERFGFKYDLNVPIHTPLRTQVVNAYCIGRGDELAQVIEDSRDRVVDLATAFAAAIVDYVIIGTEDDTAAIFLSRRQQEVLGWMAKGRTNGEIAQILGCSERTVKFHVAELSAKLNAANRTEAVAIAARQGWIVN